MIETIKNYIDGAWKSSKSERGQDVRNPATGEILARVPFSTREEVQSCIAASKAAFLEWREVPAVTRARYLFTLKELMEANFEKLARTVVAEHGKILDEARGEVRRAIENIEVAVGVPSMMMGYNLENVASGIDEYAIRVPIGPMAVIPPYNFPMMVPMWYIPYAIACGNTIIVKPSEQVPLTQTKLFELIDEAGIPPGVCSLIHGGRDVVEALIDSPEVRGVSFVGSSAVAKAVYTRSTANGKRAQCQGGAKNFIAVMPDCQLDKNIGSLITSFFGCSGQRCLAGSVFLAIGDSYEPLKKRFVEAAGKMKVGNGNDESVQMGPVISQAHKEKILSFIEIGIKEGAKLILDGRNVKVPGGEKGYFIGPCVFDDVTPEMTIAREEIFGPVASIVRVENLDQAIDVIDKNPYGNAAALYTSSGSAARQFRTRVSCGNIGINIGVPAPMALFPFGGMKNSFFGDLHGQGREAIEFYTDRKVLIERW